MQNNQKVLMLGGGTSNSMLLRLMASSTLVPVDDVLALSDFAVNDVEASLALSFTTNEYRTANTATTFAEAFTGTSPKLTYSTAAGSNSTMTQGYGPELVTNGDYSDGSTGWTEGTGWTIDTGTGVATHASGSSGNLDQSMALVAGAAYEVRLTLSNVSAGAAQVYLQGSAAENVSASLNSNGSYVFTLVAGTASSYDLRVNGSSAFNGSIDNISVREAPKLVWAPHNLVDYSEDFSQWTASNGTLTSTDVSTPVSPDGSFTADEFTSSSAYGSVQRTVTNLKVGVSYTFSAWVQKGTATNEWSIYDASNAVVLDTTTSASNGAWEKLQGTFTADNTLKVLRFQDRTGAASTGTVYLYGAHLYRSDLGGMAQVPGAATGFEYYVPTNGNAEYLPRVGHHVFNGSAWVNEGLLIESEPRTNLFDYSNDFSGNWATNSSPTVTPNASTGPDGTLSMSRISANGLSGSGVYEFVANPTGVATYTFSVFIRAVSNAGNIRLRLEGSSLTNSGIIYDAHNAAFVSNQGAAPDAYTIEDFGNDIYRVSVTATTTGAGTLGCVIYDWSTAGAVFDIYGAQLDQGQVVNGTPVDAPTPSSYMPTNGGTYTRTAQSLTVPPAEFGWPEPEYISGELVDNKTFDTDTSGWAAFNYQGHSVTISSVSGEMTVENDPTNGGAGTAYRAIPTVVGQVYSVSVDFISTTAGTPKVLIRNSTGSSSLSEITTSGAGTYTTAFIATATSTLVILSQNTTAAGNTTKWDNISVREINPLSVSIQMDGRMTYADEDAAATVRPYRWYIDNNNYVADIWVRTDAAFNGAVQFNQEDGGSLAHVRQDTYTPGVLTPFNISSRHGSTFINGAVDGVALTANTTPTALPDLSSTDLQIAYDFMGTIGTFRQFAGDIGDAGLEEATS